VKDSLDIVRSIASAVVEIVRTDPAVRTELQRILAEAIAPMAEPRPTENMLKAEQVAEWIGVSIETLKAMRARKDGPTWHNVSRRAVVYDPADVRAWLATRKRGR
jgi:hypothetical protein